jgi:hypothetical protein
LRFQDRRRTNAETWPVFVVSSQPLGRPTHRLIGNISEHLQKKRQQK